MSTKTKKVLKIVSVLTFLLCVIVAFAVTLVGFKNAKINPNVNASVINYTPNELALAGAPTVIVAEGVGATQIIAPIVDSLKGMLTGIGGSVADFFEASFLKGTGATQTMSTYGVTALTFIGLGLAMSFVTTILAKIF